MSWPSREALLKRLYDAYATPSNSEMREDAEEATTVINSGTSLPPRVSIPREVVSQVLDQECLLLNTATEMYYGLDGLGAQIWQSLAEDGDTAMTLAQLRTQYDVDDVTLRQDFSGLIEKLRAKGLLAV